MNIFHIVKDKREKFFEIFKKEIKFKKSTLRSDCSHNQEITSNTKHTIISMDMKMKF